jgi:hypothetical protein
VARGSRRVKSLGTRVVAISNIGGLEISRGLQYPMALDQPRNLAKSVTVE